MGDQIYCKPYRFNIDVKTCKSRLVIINKEYDRYGMDGLTKDQKKCYECQGHTETLPESEELICIDCRKKATEVGRFFPRIKKCNKCYQKDYSKKSKDVGAAPEVKI